MLVKLTLYAIGFFALALLLAPFCMPRAAEVTGEDGL